MKVLGSKGANYRNEKFPIEEYTALLRMTHILSAKTKDYKHSIYLQ